MKLNNNFKRLATSATLLVLATLSWAEEFRANGITYYINRDRSSVSVTSGQGKYEGDIVIPSTVTNKDEEYSVTKIKEYAFKGCEELTSVEIPGSVTTIEDYAFDGCSLLTSLTIPNSVKIIQDAVFQHCCNIRSIVIGSGVMKIGAWAFDLSTYNQESYCTSVTCLAENVPITDSSAFDNIREITLYVPAKSIGKYKAQYPWNEFGKILPLEQSPEFKK